MADHGNVTALLAQHPEWMEALGMADPVYVGQYTGTDESAASAIWAFAMGMPYAGAVDRVWFSFGGGAHFASLNTAQALGLQHLDPPSPEMPPAYRTEDAVALMLQGWRFDGKSAFLDMSKPDRVAEFNRRDAFARVLPPSWDRVDPLIYRYLVLEGTVDSQPPDLGSRPDKNAKNWYGFTFQQWLEKQWKQRGVAL